jgi:hypothetical protein
MLGRYPWFIHPVEIKIACYLLRRQAVQLVPKRPPAKEIGLAAFNLTGARSTQGKANTAVLVQPMNLVQKLRHLLHFIDDDLTNGIARPERFAKQLWILQITAKLVRFKKIDP